MTETEHGGSIESTGTVVAEYARLRPTYESYTAKLAGLIENLLETADIGVHKIEPRCKEVDKFKEKINRAGKAYEDPLREVTDLVGVRVIAYYPEDVDKICDLLRQEFEVDEANSTDKRAALDPDRFGYLSYHLVVTLGPSRKRLAEWRACAEIKAEIQVRTVLQHAWAAISHELDYKSVDHAPIELQRKLNRLSPLLELADEQFQELRNDRDTSSRRDRDKIARHDLDIEINLDSLMTYIISDNGGTFLHHVIEQVGWTEHPFWIVYISRDFDEMSSLLDKVGIDSIRQIDDVVSDAKKWEPNLISRIAHLSAYSMGNSLLIGPQLPLIVFLLYAYRDKLNPDDMDVFSWNPKFKKSISDIVFRDQEE